MAKVNFAEKAAGKTSKLSEQTSSSNRAETESPVEKQYAEGNLYKIPLDAISPDPDQPRTIFDKQKLDDLAQSIQEQGLLQPIIVRQGEKTNHFIVIAGERRFRAAKQAGLESIPALYSEGKPEEIALIENLLRDDLKPIEEAEAYQRIMNKHNYTQKQLSQIVQKKQGTISETLSLNKLPDKIKEKLRTTEVPKNVLLEISKQKDDKTIGLLFDKASSEGLTVAQVRKLTRPKPPRNRNEIDERILMKAKELKKLVIKVDKEKLHKMAQPAFFDQIDELIEALNDIKRQQSSV